MLSKLLLKSEKFLFYLVLVFLPTQLGKHFWPSFSYILGIRIDYLSPTIYLTDILIIFLLMTFLLNTSGKIKKILKSQWKFLFIVLFLLIGVTLSKSPFAGVYGLVKLLEFIFFGFYVFEKVKNVEDLKKISVIFAFGVLFESFLSIAQYFNQSSIGSIFYFFGERTFSSQTPGIANVSLNGELILRPYGTFPHPNVLAAYLIIAMTLVIFNFKFSILNFKKIFLGISILIGTISLFLTMSRAAIILWPLIMAYAFLLPLMKKLKRFQVSIPNFQFPISVLVVLVFIGSILILSPIHYRFTSFSFYDDSIAIRKELFLDSLMIIKEHLFFGVGINNFLINLPYYQKINTGSFFTYFQPVHNIFLLVMSETGIAGFIIFTWFIIKTLNNTLKKNKFSIFNFQFSILIVVIILGLFDHYFLTLQQGQLLFSFVLGLCWSKIKIDSKSRIRDNKFNK